MCRDFTRIFDGSASAVGVDLGDNSSDSTHLYDQLASYLAPLAKFPEFLAPDEPVLTGTYDNLVPDWMRRINRPAETPAKIEWRTDILSAFHAARDAAKPLVVLFSDDNCTYCQKLVNQTLPDKRIQALKDEAIFVLSNPGEDKDSAYLSEGLNISGYPTVAVLKCSEGALDEVGRIVGYLEPAEFLQQLKALLPQSDLTTSNAAPPEADAFQTLLLDNIFAV